MPRTPARCGTDSGYRRHKRLREDACPRCRKAHTAATLARKRRRALAMALAKRRLPAPRLPVSDDVLLAACLSAGEPGSLSHARACRLYRRAAAEWRQRDAEWRKTREERAPERMQDAIREAAVRRLAA